MKTQAKIVSTVIAIGFVLVTAGVIYYLKSYQTPFVRVMNPTAFETPEALGKALAERLYVDVRDLSQQGMVLGASGRVPTATRVWQSFVAELDQLNGESPAPEFEFLITAQPSFASKLQSDDGRLHIWVYPYSHLKTDQEAPSECDYKKSDLSLVCRAHRAQTHFYRKRLEAPVYSAMLEKIRANHYLLFVFDPSQ